MLSSSSGFLPLAGVFESVVTRLVDLVVLVFLLAGMVGVVAVRVLGLPSPGVFARLLDG